LARDNNESAQFVNNVKWSCKQQPTKFKNGVKVPSNHNVAMALDKQHSNRLWSDSERVEIEALEDYDTFKDLGKTLFPVSDYTKICCHMVYDVKHDGRY
jgi:hypothetical protein